MKCPFCTELENKVIDSRLSKDGLSIRRRRECLGCQRRFTTYERVEEIQPLVIKSDSRREAFNREKIRAGMIKPPRNARSPLRLSMSSLIPWNAGSRRPTRKKFLPQSSARRSWLNFMNWIKWPTSVSPAFTNPSRTWTILSANSENCSIPGMK